MADAELHLTEQPWTGWSPDQPPPRERDLRVAEGDTIVIQRVPFRRLNEAGVLEDGEERTALHVDSIGDDGLTISSVGRRLVVPNPNGTVDLLAPNVEGEHIGIGERLVLVTPTIDGGTHWTLELRRIDRSETSP